MAESTLQELIAANPIFSQCKFNVDTASHRGSVFDVIRMVTGQTEHLSQTFTRLGSRLTSKCHKIYINGKGQMTYVADAPTLVEIIWELPGDTAKAFRRQSAHLVARYLGADRTLIDEIEARFERVPTEAKVFLQAHTERPEVAPLSDVEAQNILKRKRGDLEMAEIEAKFLALKNQKRAQEIQAIEVEATHKQNMVLSRTRFVDNPEIQLFMQKDAHIASALNNYAKQSFLALMHNDEEGGEEGKGGGGVGAKFDF